MSEVQRHRMLVGDHPNVVWADMVRAEDFDRLQVEREALQQRLTVQDQRVDELVELLRLMKDNDGFLSHADWDRVDAALNPTAEAASHE